MTVPKSKYLPFFEEHLTKLSSVLMGDICLVERIKFPEKKIGSLFIADTKGTRQLGTFAGDEPTFYRVLLTGPGYFKDDKIEETIPLDVHPGDIILLGASSVKLFSSFPLLEVSESDILGVTRAGEAQARWENEESFGEFLSGLNQAVKAEIQRTTSATVQTNVR